MNLSQIENSIKVRRSNRAYTSQAVASEKIEKIEQALTQTISPFGEGVRYKIISVEANPKQPLKLGTYGTIKGAKHYMLSAVKSGKNQMETLGYQMEMAVLEAAAAGLGTCWLGGTFKRSQFAEVMALQSDELLPIVIPFGYPAEKDGLVGGLIRNLAGSNQRKNWDELFFKGALDLTGSLGAPLTKLEAGDYGTVLEMVRQAPSASNKQPWRIVKDGKRWHFILSHTKGYGSSLGYEIQRVDMGIAVCHFEMAAKAKGLSGTWVQLEVPDHEKRDDVSYIISWVEA